ncbi:hypothetical protein [Rhodovulum imhoffii]|nr:hypothetical protein [Rhodovulum imhoffii]MBK5932723.1 hypothetical protein [Rhodovulum imhoffii]
MKTATTTVQSWLSQNADLLKDSGWIYPGWPCRDAERLADMVAENPEANLVISDEGYWHFAGTARLDLDAILRVLQGFDITLVVYFRRPDAFLEAWFKQGIKKGTGAQSVRDFLDNPAVRRVVLPRLGYFETRFGRRNIIVAPFEKTQLRAGSIITDFLMRTGIPAVAPEEVAERENVSPSADRMLMAGLMRSVFRLSQKNIDALLGCAPAAVAGQPDTTIFTVDEIEEIMVRYRPDFETVQKHYGTGVAPAFFESWTEAIRPVHVTPLRAAYDLYIENMKRDVA